jgi:hypothetical protein
VFVRCLPDWVTRTFLCTRCCPPRNHVAAQACDASQIGECRRAITGGANVNERNAAGDTPLLFIAREGHYKYPPADIPAVRWCPVPPSRRTCLATQRGLVCYRTMPAPVWICAAGMS